MMIQNLIWAPFSFASLRGPFPKGTEKEEADLSVLALERQKMARFFSWRHNNYHACLPIHSQGHLHLLCD